ncbi:MAG TPA: DNA-formamidopyrimidine glycosylase family protein [Polyangiaceae bacterium]|jgi:formamidopyrimidine-DNA glycosylase|nr:DNA-formamidopyrimidine glycosylase family protein [Polyangiaceae bacterium]
MPELPDVEVYRERLLALLGGQVLKRVRLANVFVLRTYDPPISALEGKRVLGFRRLGKRIVFVFEDELFMVVHLMIAGRFLMREQGAPIPKRLGLAGFDFENATLVLTEAGTTRRASIYLVRGEAALAKLSRGGIEPLEMTLDEFAGALTSENHTLKRSLTDPRLFSGIGNAYSDEMLHDAKLSPVKLTSRLTPEEIARLYEACRASLTAWMDRLRREAGDGFPEKVTAFRPDMAVHGKYGQPCPVCGTKVQRIRYASNEVNYCPRCQTDGKVLADRGLSRLLGTDWPRSIDEFEEIEATRATTHTPAKESAPVKAAPPAKAGAVPVEKKSRAKPAKGKKP